MVVESIDWTVVAREGKPNLAISHDPDLGEVLRSQGALLDEVIDGGHLLQFRWNGKDFYINDQDSRICGAIQRASHGPLTNETYDLGLRILGSELPLELKERFIREFDYRQFLFEGRPTVTVPDLLELARMPLGKVLDMYKEGIEATGRLGPIVYVPGTIVRAVNRIPMADKQV